MEQRTTQRSRRVTDYLLADHERLDALLLRAARSEPFDAAAFAVFRAGLLRHIAIEEKLLFPAVRRIRWGEPLSRAAELRVDHAALGSLLVPTPDRSLCLELRSILEPHDAKEEGPDGVYAECEGLLTPFESAALAAAAAEYPAVPVAPHFDGPRAHRTAASALATARRIRSVRARPPA